MSTPERTGVSPFLHFCHVTSDLACAPLIRLAARRFAPALNVKHDFLVILFAVEDKRFLIHPGIDPVAIIRAAILRTLQLGRPQGASTISQQLYTARRGRDA